MTTAAIITAAGRGIRAGGPLPKQWQMLNGRAVLDHALAAFAGRRDIARLVVTVHPDDRPHAAALIGGLCVPVTLVEGGTDRAASVRAGLEALAGTGITRVLIHDGARPLLAQGVIDRVLDALDRHPGAAPALPVSDALWRGDALVAGTVPRAGLFRAQTPQGFHFAPLLAAHRAHAGGGADDVEVARAAGLDVAIVAGDEDNIKITHPGDLERAVRLLAAPEQQGAPMDIRSGNGFDVHRFGPGDHVMLCGVAVPHPRGLQGHSDADVGLHALADAIYGALAEGDIGTHFPPSDPRWKGAQSHVFLSHAAERIAARGYRLANADVTLICEAPKIAPHTRAMRAEVARLLACDADRISVKATTTERLGFAGRAEGIAAQAGVLLVGA